MIIQPYINLYPVDFVSELAACDCIVGNYWCARLVADGVGFYRFVT
ncbi:hypothetical protein [Aphanothece hegewaldii]|nr:hypothetical protein [Aphanothece hegewaldii]